MIQLNEQQIQALESNRGVPPRVINAHTNETFVLLPIEEYERLKAAEYDDAPWTRQELEAAAWEIGQKSEWDEYDDTDDEPVRS